VEALFDQPAQRSGQIGVVEGGAGAQAVAQRLASAAWLVAVERSERAASGFERGAAGRFARPQARKPPRGAKHQRLLAPRPGDPERKPQQVFRLKRVLLARGETRRGGNPAGVRGRAVLTAALRRGEKLRQRRLKGAARII